jgi:hypothetical protein
MKSIIQGAKGGTPVVQKQFGHCVFRNHPTKMRLLTFEAARPHVNGFYPIHWNNKSKLAC